ncbi:restriction endonuclease subunit S [Senegalia sp. (in: firmicutes)]|uniref:restriction endonuclease subunit S n=1 Tax=Senegalia sp. (in: firmicutes) TaxID=1924098 RepID=UPI003F9E645D
MKKDKLVPKRRFKEFVNDKAWEQRKLGEVTDVMDGDRGNNYPSGDDFCEQGHTLFLSAMNVTRYGFSFDSNQYITAEKSNLLGNGKLELDDIVLTSRGSLGHVAWYNSDIKKLVPFARINSGMLILRSKEEIEPSYIAQYLKSPLGERQIDLISFGSAQPQLTKKDISNYNILVPGKDEQIKLGTFFSNLDKLITLHQRKLKKLKELKSSYLSEMFPQEGEKYPKRRFDGFTDPWEQRKLGHLGSVAMNKRIFKDQTSEAGDIPFYKIGTFGGEPDAFIPRKLYEEYKAKYPYPEVGDILISASGSIGRTVEYTGKDEYFQDSNIVWLKHDGRLDNSFLKQFYLVVKWEGLEGSTIKRLYNKNILETEILAPSLLEQAKIGTFFHRLDKLITLHQRKLEKLENIKKAYLNEMFV